jgi:predicted enzyme related to lactoylglutathione lyase
MTSDQDKARAFYCELFGWAADDPTPEFGNYMNFSRNGALVAGCFPRMPGTENVPDVWSVYLATDDAQKTIDAATANGGAVIAGAMQVGDLGTMGVVTDPGAAAIGLWQPGSHKGFTVFGEAGTPSWFDLQTRDYDTCVSFYRDVFRWDTATVSDTPEFRYTAMREGETWLAGILDAENILPQGVPAHWSVYFGVDDADATTAKIVELGGAIVRQPEDTPYGRLATATDPTGAQFKLVAPNDQMPAR